MKSGKIWGETERLLETPMIEIHRLNIKPGYQCSLHSHRWKWNAFIVISGRLSIEVCKSDYDLTDVTDLGSGDFTTVKPGEFHRFICREACEALEIYYPHWVTEDIVRRGCGGPVDNELEDGVSGRGRA